MKWHIPMGVIERAIEHAKQDLSIEAIGFFAVRAANPVNAVQRPTVEFKSFKNIARLPRVMSEASAQDLADMIVNQKLAPIAMFHSHPSGERLPSLGDMDFFPINYVEHAFVWTWTAPRSLTQYTPNGYTEHVQIDQVFIDAV